MMLPNRNMQSRGIAYPDEMAPTLYQCFEDGLYSQFFLDTSVSEWVESQGLKMLFESEIIDRAYLLSTIEGYSPKQSFKRTRKREHILEVINYANDLLDKRNNSQKENAKS